MPKRAQEAPCSPAYSAGASAHGAFSRGAQPGTVCCAKAFLQISGTARLRKRLPPKARCLTAGRLSGRHHNGGAGRCTGARCVNGKGRWRCSSFPRAASAAQAKRACRSSLSWARRSASAVQAKRRARRIGAGKSGNNLRNRAALRGGQPVSPRIARTAWRAACRESGFSSA